MIGIGQERPLLRRRWGIISPCDLRIQRACL